MSSKFKIKPGVVSFKEFFKGFGGTFDDNGYYVDKTRFLKSIVEYDPRICLFTRPRRFGKSMFLSMMETFFSPNCEDVNDLSLHQKIFSKFEIFKDKVFSDALMGKIPVLHITFAGAKSDTSIENSIDKLVNAVCICANKYLFLSTSDKLSESEKQRFNDLCNFDKLNLGRLTSDSSSIYKIDFQFDGTGVSWDKFDVDAASSGTFVLDVNWIADNILYVATGEYIVLSNESNLKLELTEDSKETWSYKITNEWRANLWLRRYWLFRSIRFRPSNCCNGSRIY